MTDSLTFEAYAHRLTIAWWLRSNTEHRLAAVRAAVADVIEDGDGQPLADALAEVYEDPEQWVFLEALTRGWSADSDPAWAECGRILRDARATLWDRGLAGL